MRVGSLRQVELALPHRLADVRRIHLVAATVAERRRRARGFPEGAVERRGVLGRIREDRKVFEPISVERSPKGADPAVHHVARGNHVRAGLRMAYGRPGEEIQGQVVHDLPVLDDATVTVRRVLAEADVGDEDELGHPLTECAERALHDPVVLPRARSLLVLGLRDAEQQHRLDTECVCFLGLVAQEVDRALHDRIQTLERILDPFARADEERVDEVSDIQPCLAHELAESAGSTEPSKAGDGKPAAGESVGGAHVSNLRTPSRAAAAKRARRPASHAASRATVPQGLRS